MSHRKIVVLGEFLDDPNVDLIADFLRQEYPDMNEGKEEPILECVMREIIGSRQVRLAGAPTLESQVAMREVVRACIKAGHPIPVLVVSGPKKTVIGESIDLAELSALKMLACLNKRVKVYFPQGIVVRIRLEDTTGYYLEEGVQDLRESIDRYIEDFATLIRVMDYNFITPIREQTLMSESQLREAAGKIFPLLMSYLTDSEGIEEAKWEGLGGLEGIAEDWLAGADSTRDARLLPHSLSALVSSIRSPGTHGGYCKVSSRNPCSIST